MPSSSLSFLAQSSSIPARPVSEHPVVFAIPAVLYVKHTDIGRNTGGDVALELPEGADPAAWTKVTYVDGQSTIVSAPSMTMGYDAAEKASNFYEVMGDLLRLHTTVCRIAENHPANHGLVPHKVEANERWGSTPSLVDRAGVTRGYGQNILDKLLALLPERFVNPEIGWFRPDQDPTVFGAYHLFINGDLTAQSSWRSSGDDLGWVLRQTAIDGAVDKMGWDNVARMKEAVARIHGEDLDLVMTMRALTDTERVAKAAKEHAYKQAARAARITFANSQLRPRLVPDIVEKVAKDAGYELKTGWRMDDDHDISGLLSLDGWAITRGLEKHTLEVDGRGNIKAVNACYRLVLKDALGPQKFIALVEGVQAALTARKVGTVAYDPTLSDRLWVALKPEMLLKHRAAFGIADAAALVTLNGPVLLPADEPADA